MTDIVRAMAFDAKPPPCEFYIGRVKACTRQPEDVFLNNTIYSNNHTKKNHTTTSGTSQEDGKNHCS